MAAATITACPSCVFGPVASTTLSFTLHAIETITVSVIPHVTIWTNGTEKTSYQSITETKTDFVGGSNSSTPKTFTNKKDIVWTVGDATLTYPTSYIQYLSFNGASVTSGDGHACVEPTPSYVALPESTDEASFIYPIAANMTAAMPLPTPLLDYLTQLPEVSAQFGGAALTGCAPLSWTPPASATAYTTSPSGVYPSESGESFNASTTSSISLSSSSRRPGNYSQPLASSASRQASSASLKGSGSTTFPPFTTVSSVFQSPPVVSTTTSTSLRVRPGHPGPQPYGPSSNPAASRPVGTFPSTAQSQASTTSSTPQGTLTHTTAFIIEPITGPTTYTTMTPRRVGPTHKPSPHHTTTNASPPPNAYKPHTSGDNQPTVGPYGPGNGQQPHVGQHHSKGNQLPPVYTHGHTTISAQSGGDVVIGSNTVHPGQEITIGTGSSQTTVALETKGGHTHLVVGTNTFVEVPHHHVTPAAGAATKSGVGVAVITTHDHTITAIRSGKSIIVVDGSSTTTVRAGGHATFESQTIQAPHHDGSIAVNGHGVPLTPAGNLQAVITAGGHTFTALQFGKSAIFKDGSSTILVKGGSKTQFEGQTVSLQSRGSVVVVNGKTETLSATNSPTLLGSAVVTAGGHTLTVLGKAGSMVVKDGSSTLTVKDGKTATFESQTVGVPRHGGAVVVNGKTASFTTVSTSTPTTGVGDYIKHGLGAQTTTVSPAYVPTSTNAASHATGGLSAALLCLFSMLAVL